MSEPYRDDLEAAQLRTADLEREHAALEARHAELEARKTALAAPVVTRIDGDDLTAWEVNAFVGALGVCLLVCVLAGVALLESVVLLEGVAIAGVAALGARRSMLRRKR